MSTPRDAQVMSAILRDMGVTEHEPRVISQMLDLAYRYSTQLLSEAKAISEHAGKKMIDAEDVRLAIDNERDRSMLGTVPRQLLLELADEKNSVPLPPLKQSAGLRLPNDRFCLLQPNYRWKETETLTQTHGHGHGHGQQDPSAIVASSSSLPPSQPSPRVVFDLQSNPLKRRAEEEEDYDQ